MRKLVLALAVLATLVVSAQTKGKFEIVELNGFKMHVYYSNDVMEDISYIFEGEKGLVTLEQPLFKENVAEFESYLKKIDKPVEKIITNYHLGGTGVLETAMPEGMPEFVKGEVYGGMMANFAQTFGDAIVPLPTGKIEKIPFGKIQKWAGIEFDFEHGATTDFPAASIIIGRQVYYTHWTPVKAHMSSLQISSRAAVDAELKESEEALNSGAKYFIGGHGGYSFSDALTFKIDYLKTIKNLLTSEHSAHEFAIALKNAYPGLAGEENVTNMAEALYQ